MTITAPAPLLTGERQPTPEQQIALDLADTNENFVIIALAGTGKTTTLQMIARRRPERRGLYLAFNRAIALEAAEKFKGTNVDARTAHSLAYATHGAPRRGRLDKRLNATDSAKALEMDRIDIPGYKMVHKVAANSAMKIVIDTVNRFCTTADEEIGRQHVQLPARFLFSVSDKAKAIIGNDVVQLANAEEVEDNATQQLIDEVVRWAKIYWQDLLVVDGGGVVVEYDENGFEIPADPYAEVRMASGVLPVTHSHYLKMWALSKPQLPFDYIMYDEAQDSDPVTTSVVLAQKGAQVIVVGDRHQAIYKWRGAVDALDGFEGEKIALTQSFRFGEEIADFANVFLETLGADLRVRGTEGKRASVHTDRHSDRRPDAVICRTNGGAMNEVLFFLKQGLNVNIAGEKKAAELRSIAQAAIDLDKNGWTSHPDFAGFRKWQDVLDSVASEDADENTNLASMINTIVRVGAVDVIAAIDSCVPADQADISISTAHVSKGLEWRHVRIGADFPYPKIDKETGEFKPLKAEEARLMYVAVTRAMRHLDAKNIAWIYDFAAGVTEDEAEAR
ncbi:UvrD-helicase domain-containing protein [Leifsonia sp. Leaf264]|uniref:UvrD-helicase domain-containing protein n=1 Tax=Leifsonia sp. Leaf264 TaxID=1736314 RepID=UPI0006FFA129|nr:UvrD-helicase domain-containing protein [Leifsonia sp. Leaf264]KQO98299.1 hypothetical protein ASF30_09575 [Leifsonia sp. Leaf264]